MQTRNLIFALAMALLLSPGVTHAQGMSDEELDRRIQWLETTLDAGETYSKIWQYGWTTGYSLGVVLGTVQAATTHDKDTRVNSIVTASKAVIGTTRLLWSPHPGRLGAQPMRDVVGDGREAKLQRLAVGEAQLAEIAKRADERYRWQPHAGNVGLNLVGGAFVAGFGDPVDAAISVSVGILVGELMIFTAPKRGAAEQQAYQREFAAIPQDPPWSVALVPVSGGAGIRIDF
jgi:hypothetical protein